ncbi:MAG TPA: FAD-dependent oxidoreductase [Bacteroidales bacterium]|nr:FAD-dependent oxidoreductase [Bacteroidales bacterium]
MKGTQKHVIIAGGGVAGMEAAGALAEMGYRVTLVEKGQDPGGHLLQWHALFPDSRPAEEVKSYLRKRIGNHNITVITGTAVEKIKHHPGGTVTVNLSGSKEEKADAVIVATGFDLFDARRKEEYGYGIYDNVITAPELETMFNGGRVTKADGSVPSRIGMIHCVGSRDEKVNNNHCSKVCCVTAVKQAIELRKMMPACEVFCFYMDMRMYGPYYEELYRESQEVHNVNFIRGKVSEASVNINNRLVIKVEDTLAGRPLKMELDIMVLMVGMEMAEAGTKLAVASGFRLGINRFLEAGDHHYGNNLSGVSGVFYAGTCTAPMNITDTISHARAAVAETVRYLDGR